MNTDPKHFTVASDVSLQPAEGAIRFHTSPSVEILRLDKDGMTYKGQRIEDAGEAHRAWLETMKALREAAP
jgi:hypothetical protein